MHDRWGLVVFYKLSHYLHKNVEQSHNRVLHISMDNMKH